MNHGLSSRSLLYGNHVVTYCSKPASALDQNSSTPIGNDMDGGREDISRYIEVPRAPPKRPKTVVLGKMQKLHHLKQISEMNNPAGVIFTSIA